MRLFQLHTSEGSALGQCRYTLNRKGAMQLTSLVLKDNVRVAAILVINSAVQRRRATRAVWCMMYGGSPVSQNRDLSARCIFLWPVRRIPEEVQRACIIRGGHSLPVSEAQ
jgi:hypothetical protein